MKLLELARTVRSKNAGPLKVTLDLLFDEEVAYRRALQSPALEPGSVALLKGRPKGTVEVLPTLPRWGQDRHGPACRLG
jgi:hypothetical protein